MKELKSYLAVKHFDKSDEILFIILADCGNCALRQFHKLVPDRKDYSLYCEMDAVKENEIILLKCQAENVLNAAERIIENEHV